jgi:hypothetical protein
MSFCNWPAPDVIPNATPEGLTLYPKVHTDKEDLPRNAKFRGSLRVSLKVEKFNGRLENCVMTHGIDDSEKVLLSFCLR